MEWALLALAYYALRLLGFVGLGPWMGWVGAWLEQRAAALDAEEAAFASQTKVQQAQQVQAYRERLIKVRVDRLLGEAHAHEDQAEMRRLRERAAFLKQKRLERAPMLRYPSEWCAARLPHSDPALVGQSTSRPIEQELRLAPPLVRHRTASGAIGACCKWRCLPWMPLPAHDDDDAAAYPPPYPTASTPTYPTYPTYPTSSVGLV